MEKRNVQLYKRDMSVNLDLQIDSSTKKLYPIRQNLYLLLLSVNPDKDVSGIYSSIISKPRNSFKVMEWQKMNTLFSQQCSKILNTCRSHSKTGRNKNRPLQCQDSEREYPAGLSIRDLFNAFLHR